MFPRLGPSDLLQFPLTNWSQVLVDSHQVVSLAPGLWEFPFQKLIERADIVHPLVLPCPNLAQIAPEFDKRRFDRIMAIVAASRCSRECATSQLSRRRCESQAEVLVQILSAPYENRIENENGAAGSRACFEGLCEFQNCGIGEGDLQRQRKRSPAGGGHPLLSPDRVHQMDRNA